MNKPQFDSIKNYEEFTRYKWDRVELKNICRAHGLLFVGTEKKLNKVIEAYFSGEVIPPRRNWYTNSVLLSYVNENALSMGFDFILFAVSLFLTVIGIVNRESGSGYVLFLVFGITGLILAVLCIYWGRDLDVIMSWFPRCGDKKFTRAQVDEQANSELTVRLDHEDVLLAPDMLIGVTAGVAAVAYEDIASLQVRQKWHTERIGPRGSTRYRDYYTYKIIVRTNKGRKIAISDSKGSMESTAERIYEHCLRYNPGVELLDMKKSSMAPDGSPRQVTEGKGVRQMVGRAVKEQALVKVSVAEDTRKRFISYHIRSALILIPESIVVGMVSGICVFTAVRILRSVRGIVIVLPAVFFPVYAIYNLCSVLNLIRKDDIEFYSGEILDKNDKGYFIKGVNGYRFNFIKKMQPDNEPDIGDTVILARFGDGYSLISEDDR